MYHRHMRIIAGEFGGRRLKVPKGNRTRPTPDRVREALFSVLGDQVDGARVVELFAGTGSLGLEALSRGASEAVFCETGRDALHCLTENIQTLGVSERCTIHRRSAFELPRLIAEHTTFDLVFCDPPYRLTEDAGGRGKLAQLLGSLPVAGSGCVLYEHRAGSLGSFTPQGLILEDVRRWGSTGIARFTRPA